MCSQDNGTDSPIGEPVETSWADAGKRWLALVLFPVCLLLIYPYVFKFLTAILEYILATDVYWEKTTFLYNLIRGGLAIAFSWCIAKGVYNLLNKRAFLHDMKSGKLFAVVFSVVVFMTLWSELDALVPEYADYGIESPINILRGVVMAFTVLIGIALWRSFGKK